MLFFTQKTVVSFLKKIELVEVFAKQIYDRVGDYTNTILIIDDWVVYQEFDLDGMEESFKKLTPMLVHELALYSIVMTQKDTTYWFEKVHSVPILTADSCMYRARKRLYRLVEILIIHSPPHLVEYSIVSFQMYLQKCFRDLYKRIDKSEFALRLYCFLIYPNTKFEFIKELEEIIMDSDKLLYDNTTEGPICPFFYSNLRLNAKKLSLDHQVEIMKAHLLGVASEFDILLDLSTQFAEPEDAAFCWEDMVCEDLAALDTLIKRTSLEDLWIYDLDRLRNRFTKLPKLPPSEELLDSLLHGGEEAVEQAGAEDQSFARNNQDATQPPQNQNPTLPAGPLHDLMALTGLQNVKAEINTRINMLRTQQIRKKRGLPVIPTSMHMVFTGNPGTGKTTVARLLAQIYQDIGVLPKGHLVEVDRSQLVAEYVGQTAPKVRKVVEQALGGMLFIDEAYTLSKDARDSFGREAIDTLLKLMEDFRNDFIVIVAGYTEEMEQFLASNPGLQSRFNTFLHFDDYSPDDLVEIFTSYCAQYGYNLQLEASMQLIFKVHDMHLNRTKHFGNAREMRNLFERTVARHSNRIAQLKRISNDQLTTIREEDIESF